MIRKLPRKLSIRAKVATILAFVFLFSAGVFSYSSRLLHMITKETELLVKESVMVELVLDIRRHEKNLILRGDEKFMGQIRYSELVMTLVDKLKKTADEYRWSVAAKRRAHVNEVMKQLNTYTDAFTQYVHSLKNNASRKESEGLITSGRLLLAACKHLEDETVLLLDGYKRRIIVSRGVVVGVFILTALITYWLISRQILSPIKKLQELSRDMSKMGVLKPGQLKQVDAVIKEISSDDEIGELARAYRSMLMSYYNSYWGLQDKMREVEELSRMKSDFASMVSHELRTPLTAIKEVVDLLYYEISGQLAKDQKEFLKVAKRNIDRLSRLINDILDFSKLSSRKMSMKIEDVPLNDIIESVLHIYKVVIEKKDVHLMTHIRVSKGVLARVDSDRVNQILTNLIGNAIKFTEKGSITVSTTLLEGDKVRISIKDTGEGIAPEDVSQLFQPFTRLEEANGQKKREGTGLGLAICKLIVDQLGGTIGVESKKGEGSTFFFTLPLAHPS